MVMVHSSVEDKLSFQEHSSHLGTWTSHLSFHTFTGLVNVLFIKDKSCNLVSACSWWKWWR